MPIQISISNAVGARSATATGGIDPDAQAFITAAAITDPTQQAAINTLVVDLKGYDVWTKMSALYPFVGGTASTHKFNLKNPLDTDAAFRLVFSGGWTHSSNGIIGNGTNTNAQTKLIPSSVLSINSKHVSIYSRTNTAAGFDIMSHTIGPVVPYDLLALRATIFFVNEIGYSFNEAYPNSSGYNLNSTGFYISTRTASNAKKLYKNNSILLTASTVSSTQPTNQYVIGSDSRNVDFTSRNYAFASIGDGLTDTDATNFYTAVQAFQTTLGRSIGTQTVSDADAQAFVTAADIQDQVEANAINNLVIGMKADGTWSKMKAVYPFVGGTSSTHKFNLKNPLDTDAAFRLVFNGGFTHSSNGITGNGTNGFADTKFNPISQSSNLNSFSLSVYSRTNLAGNMFDIGNADSWANGVKGTNIITRYGSSNRYVNIANGNYVTINYEANSQGFYCGATNGSATQILYKNGSNVLSGTSTQSGFSNCNLYISAVNDLSLGAQQYSSKNYAFAHIGDGLTDTDAANLNTRVTTFQTALNRNI